MLGLVKLHIRMEDAGRTPANVQTIRNSYHEQNNNTYGIIYRKTFLRQWSIRYRQRYGDMFDAGKWDHLTRITTHLRDHIGLPLERVSEFVDFCFDDFGSAKVLNSVADNGHQFYMLVGKGSKSALNPILSRYLNPDGLNRAAIKRRGEDQ